MIIKSVHNPNSIFYVKNYLLLYQKEEEEEEIEEVSEEESEEESDEDSTVKYFTITH